MFIHRKPVHTTTVELTPTPAEAENLVEDTYKKMERVFRAFEKRMTKMSEDALKRPVIEDTIQPTVMRLQTSIDAAIGGPVGDSDEGADLLAAAGEAVGVLRAYQGFCLPRLMYELAMTAAMNGHYPAHLDAMFSKSGSANA